MASVTIEGLTKRYGTSTVVDSIDLTIRDGEFLTLLGPSGCGKTTTLRCIAGLERPDGGTIRIGERAVAGPGTFVQPNKRHIGMVFQSYALWPHMSVIGNVSYPLKRARLSRGVQRERGAAALAAVGLEHYRDRPVGTLSGGQQQRVALARAIVAEPPVILFDEPLSNLDTRLRGEMREELRALRQRLGTTSIYVTHDQIEALTLSDRIVILNQGVIQQIGSPQEIYQSPANLFVAEFLGFENVIAGVVTRAEGASHTVAVGDAGALEVKGYAAFAVGDKVLVAARSSDMRLLDAEEPGGVRATVRTRMFLGDHTTLQADIGDQHLSFSLSSSSPVLAGVTEGSDVRIQLETGTFSMFPNPFH